MSETGPGSGSSRNGALYLERPANTAKWPGPLKKGAAKKLVGEILATLQSAEFNHGVARLSTLRNMKVWVDKARFGLPEYLTRSCPCYLREGRRLKTKFRIGCHPLRSSATRMGRVRNATCPCCDTGDSETIHHALFECKAFSDERDAFLAALCSICPDARRLPDENRMRFLLGDALPREIVCTAILSLFRRSGLVTVS